MVKNPTNVHNAVNVVNVLLKTEKNSHVGCVGNSVVTYVGFSSTCLNMACGNLDTWKVGISLVKGFH